ncbi:MAG: hypothetical protein J6R14_05155 [Bacteroidales bacterium]|nr:hypothetical protein [Bacteroidales bacterium]
MEIALPTVSTENKSTIMNKEKLSRFSLNELISFIKREKRGLLLIALASFAAYFVTTVILDWEQISAAFMSGWNSVE